jgi:hypothetical protein
MEGGMDRRRGGVTGGDVSVHEEARNLLMLPPFSQVNLLRYRTSSASQLPSFGSLTPTPDLPENLIQDPAQYITGFPEILFLLTFCLALPLASGFRTVFSKHLVSPPENGYFVVAK